MEDLNLFGDLNPESSTLTGVYGLNDESVKTKMKRLIRVALDTDKTHEIIEMCKAEADSADEAMVLLCLVDKFFAEKMHDSAQDAMGKLVSIIVKKFVKFASEGRLDEELIAELMQSLEDEL